MLGSGIYALIGAVAGAVGGALWVAFAVGVSVALITGVAYAELATAGVGLVDVLAEAADVDQAVKAIAKDRPQVFSSTYTCPAEVARR